MPLACPSCRATLPDEWSGSSVRCPVCAQLVQVPHPPALAAALDAPLAAIIPAQDLDLFEARSTLPAEGAGGGSHTTHIFPFLDAPKEPGEIGRLDHYRVFRLIGQGGMGVVFEAEDTVLRRRVALKVMRPELARNEAARLRFLREARSAAAIHHPHVVTIYQVGPDRNVPYLAMELLHGESLETRLRRVGKIPVSEVLRIGREIAEGLAAAHQRGLVHRDVKPANVWLTLAGEGDASRPHAGPTVKLIDFGLALLGGDDANLTRSGAVLGTPAYMAPEQADGGAVDGRADLFSLGCMLYRMATGEVPFKGQGTISTLRAMVKTQPQSPSIGTPEVPSALSRLILQLLAEDPNQRPASAAVVATRLRALEQRVGQRPWVIWIGAALVFIVALTLIGTAGGVFLVARMIALHRPTPTDVAPRPEDPGMSAITRIQPPERDFYSKRLDYRGIAIKAHADVADEALLRARGTLERMLGHCPQVLENLVAAGAELHIIGKDQQTSDLPEHRHLKGQRFDGDLTVDQRSRGLGGLFASCGEENLLELPGDRYAGRDICVHEFAHTIRAYGLSEDIRRQLEYQYRRSLAKGLWKGAYAAKNDDEFFSELSMWYFGTQGDTANLLPKPAGGSEGLRSYDPEAFALVDDIYTGKLIPGRQVFSDLPMVSAGREKTLRSEQSAIATTVQFVNRTPRPMQIFWLDFQGQRKLYNTLPGNSQFVQTTFAGHPWVVVDDGKVRGIYIPRPEPGRAVISEP